MTTSENLLLELERLAQEGATMMSNDPRSAIARFEAAHAIALRVGERDRAVMLSMLLARASTIKGASFANALKFSRRAVREASGAMTPNPNYTLGHFCELIARRTTAAGKRRRAATLWSAAAAAYGSAAASDADAGFARVAEECKREAERLGGQ
jgi:hypothetical protein